MPKYNKKPMGLPAPSTSTGTRASERLKKMYSARGATPNYAGRSVELTDNGESSNRRQSARAANKKQGSDAEKPRNLAADDVPAVAIVQQDLPQPENDNQLKPMNLAPPQRQEESMEVQQPLEDLVEDDVPEIVEIPPYPRKRRDEYFLVDREIYAPIWLPWREKLADPQPIGEYDYEMKHITYAPIQLPWRKENMKVKQPLAVHCFVTKPDMVFRKLMLPNPNLPNHWDLKIWHGYRFTVYGCDRL